jgi:hypothetical protein
VSGKPDAPCIWVLEPDKLNHKATGHDLLVQSDAVDYDHEHEKVLYLGKKLQYPLAIFPTLQNPRIFAQKGHFTIHGAIEKPIEEICPDCVTKIPLPPDALADARAFLHLAGLNEYSVFPDIDGLARYLTKEHGLDRRKRIATNKAAKNPSGLVCPDISEPRLLTAAGRHRLPNIARGLTHRPRSPYSA